MYKIVICGYYYLNIFTLFYELYNTFLIHHSFERDGRRVQIKTLFRSSLRALSKRGHLNKNGTRHPIHHIYHIGPTLNCD